MPEPLAFFAGRLLPQAQARLPLHDAGFVMGATVTDLCRTFHRQLYRWNDHLERFAESCRAAQILPIPGGPEITARAEELLGHNAALLNAGQELALVLFATPGTIGYYLGEDGGPGESETTFGMHTFPLPFHRYRRWVKEGATLMVPSVRQVPAASINPHIKMRSRLHWWLADREAQRAEPGSAAVLLNNEGHLTETAGANLLIVRGGTILSPPRSTILEGISLRVVRELSGRLGIPFAETPLTIADVAGADEALLTGTSYCLVGVSRFQARALPFPGRTLERLLTAWSVEVGLDIHGQILAP